MALFGIDNNGIYAAGGAVLIALIIWLIVRHFQGGRLGLERHALQEDNRLKQIDNQLIVDVKQEHNEAGYLRDLFYSLNKRAVDLNFNVYADNIKANFDYIVAGLDILSKGDKSVLEDKQKVQEFFNAIDVYLNSFTNSQDSWIVSYVRQIRTSQKRLFNKIIEQDGLLREKFALLRLEERQTVAEEGLDRAA